LLEVESIIHRAGLDNPYAAETPPWLATSYRLAALAEPAGIERARLMKLGRQTARRAARKAKRFRNTLPQSLREVAIFDALAGNEHRAVEVLDRALAIAEQQDARYERALTQLAKARVLNNQPKIGSALQEIESLGGASWMIPAR
jgi:hypothetical protein